MRRYGSLLKAHFMLLALAVMLGVGGGMAVQQASAAVTLVKDGKAQAAIVLPASPTQDEVLAAAELRSHVQKISALNFPSWSAVRRPRARRPSCSAVRRRGTDRASTSEK